jgi:hypothetical protein
MLCKRAVEFSYPTFGFYMHWHELLGIYSGETSALQANTKVKVGMQCARRWMGCTLRINQRISCAVLYGFLENIVWVAGIADGSTENRCTNGHL